MTQQSRWRRLALLWLFIGLAAWCVTAPTAHAKITGFCEGKTNCVKHPWQRSDVQFFAGASAFREGRIWEYALTLGATTQIPLTLFGGDVTMVNQAEIWSNTRIPEVNAHVGTIIMRSGFLIQEVGFTVGVKINAVNQNVYVRPWAVGEFRSLQFFPSARLHWRKGWFGLDLSLFDGPDTAIGRIGIAVGNFGIGYSFPYGGDLQARFSIGPATALQLRAHVNWFDNQFSAGILIGIVFGKGTMYRF